MAAIRYVALIALVLWIGAAAGVLFGDLFTRPQLLSYACGGLIVVTLVVMKFVGPPPRAFFLRTGITVLMLLVTAAATFQRTASTMWVMVNLGLGLVLLFWYSRE